MAHAQAVPSAPTAHPRMQRFLSAHRYQLAALAVSASLHLCIGWSLANQAPVSAGTQGASQPARITTVPLQTSAVALTPTSAITHAPVQPVAVRKATAREQDQPPPASSAIDKDEAEAPRADALPQAQQTGVSTAPDLSRYFNVAELVERPTVVRDISTDEVPASLPGELKAAVVTLLINESGEVDKVEVEEESLAAEAKDYIVALFSRMKFSPGKLDGMVVKSQMKIEVDFGSLAPRADQPLETAGYGLSPSSQNN